MNKAFDKSKYALWIDPNKVYPYERNAKQHDEKQIKNIANSIRRFGWQQDTVITSDNVLVIGHGRRLAALKLGCEMPYHVIDKTADELTDEDIRELRIADNQTNAETGFDFEMLDAEISDLDFAGFDFDFSVDEQEQEQEEEAAEVVEDDYDEDNLPDEPKAKLGDIYQLGRHRLMCGDSTDKETVDRLMNGVKADMVFTDPPYGVSANGGRGDTKKKLKMQEIINDNLRDNELCDFLQSSFSIMPIKDGASVYICYPWATQEEFTKAIKNCGYTLQNCIIWRKNVFGLNGFKGYRPQYEMIYFCSKSDYQWYGDLAQSNVWDFNRSTEHIGGHPTVKPIELIAKALQNSSKKEDRVYDGFGGSGSTLIACEQLNRTCYMMELDPHYVDVIIDRWEKFTGEKAVLLNGE